MTSPRNLGPDQGAEPKAIWSIVVGEATQRWVERTGRRPNDFSTGSKVRAEKDLLASADGTKKITASGQTLSLSGTIVTLTSTGTISTQTGASTMVSTINTSIANVNAALAKMASSSKKFGIQATFVSKLVDTLNAGVGNLVDADMAVESAKLQSLQVKQQLGVQALSIANQAPSITLSLFR